MKLRPTSSIQGLQDRGLWLSCLLVLMVLASGPVEAAVRAVLDRDTVYAGDTLTLTIESDGRQSGLQPDLTPLEKNFDVLGTSTSTQVSYINGRRSDKTSWQVQLQPRATGQLRIPPLSIGGQQTAPLELKVSEAPQAATNQANRHVFVQAEVDSTDKQTYVQQQIPYTVRLYYDGSLQEGELSAPTLKDAVVEQLGKDKNYSTVTNGRPYSVVERHYVISPEKSGSLHIPPATFNGRVAVQVQQRQRRSRSGSLMEKFLGNNPFLNDPFFRDSLLSGNFFGGTPDGKPIVARSQSINIDIQPRPVTAGRNWLPAEAVTLDDSWTNNPPQFKAGEPVSRTLTIKTKGLSGSQIPELAVTAPANTRLYPETQEHESRTDGKTIYGVRTQTLTYIPGAQGTLDIPAITLGWWDTRHDKEASTTVAALQFRVLPGTAGTAGEAPAPLPGPVAKQSTPASPASEAAATKIRRWLPGRLPETITANWLWAATGIGGLLVLLVVMRVRRTKQRRQTNPQSTAEEVSQAVRHTRQNEKSALRALAAACTANDPHAAAKALLALSCAHWPDEPPRSLDALAASIENGQMQLRELDHSLYAADTSDWNGKLLWQEFKHGLEEKKLTGHGQDDGLKPLYLHPT